MAIHHIPDGFHTVTPYLVVNGADKLLTFLEQTFEAVRLERHTRPDGTVGHAAVRIGDSVVEMGDARAEWPALAAGLHVYVPDTDATYGRALAAGATSLMAPADMFYGERGASVRDPLGITWHIATKTENVTPEELERRMAAMGQPK